MLNCFERSRAKEDVAEKCFELQPRKIKRKIKNTLGIGEWT